MAKISLKQKLENDVILIDGAMGTQLVQRGVKIGECMDNTCVESPDIVKDVHTAYFNAGSDAVLTNTFGANAVALGRHGLVDKVEGINAAAATLAREAAGEDKYVIGDIGPCGDFLQPLGTLNPDVLKDAFTQQAKALISAGADAFIIETMTALEEAEIAVEAVKAVAGDTPVFSTMSFEKAGEDFRTMMGVTVEAFVSKVVPLGVDAIGFNCGKMSLDEYVELAGRFESAVSEQGASVTLLAEPNAGLPEMVEGVATYKVEPDEFAAAIEKTITIGFNIVGGCCGTSPKHIAAVAQSVSAS